MKHVLLASIVVALFACAKTEAPSDGNSGTGSGGSGSTGCGTYNGHTLYKGSQGGCYYINGSGNKTYVDASHCHC